MAVIKPFDLKEIFVTTLAGSPEIFAFISILFIAGLSAYFKMSNALVLIMFALFGIIMSQYIGGLYLLVLLIGGLTAYYGIKKIIL